MFRLISGHAVTVIISLVGISRYPSSCVRDGELSRPLIKKSSSSSEYSDAWSFGIACGHGCYPGPISPLPLYSMLSRSAIITIEFKRMALIPEREHARDWTVLITIVLANGWAPLGSSWRRGGPNNSSTWVRISAWAYLKGVRFITI